MERGCVLALRCVLLGCYCNRWSHSLIRAVKEHFRRKAREREGAGFCFRPKVCLLDLRCMRWLHTFDIWVTEHYLIYGAEGKGWGGIGFLS